MSSKKKIALCHPWDFTSPSAEKALSLRMELAAKNIDIECINIDTNGYVQDENYKNTGVLITSIPDVEFVFHHHFNSKKSSDMWTIMSAWNPPVFPYDWHGNHTIISNYLQHDDYVSASPEGCWAVEHINMLLAPHRRYFDNANILYAALPRSIHLEPTLKSIKKADRVFYVGVNWERMTGQQSRHEGLFSLLDQDDCISLFGPEKLGDVRPWEGFSCYKGEIPFDYGYALIKKINEVGIALTLSSAVHQKSGIMTNRIFESAASGALILADKNDFVNRHFGDSVIQIENEGDTQETYHQIKRALTWVKKNPEEAYEKAKRSQQIYLEKFSLEKNLSKVISDVEKRKELLVTQIHAQCLDEEIDVIVRWYVPSLERFENMLRSINKQTYPKIRLIVVCDAGRQSVIDAILKGYMREGITYVVCPVFLFHENIFLKRRMMTGELLNSGLQHVKNDYVAFIEPLEEWFSDHLATLKRSLEDRPDKVMAYVPSLKYVWRGGIIDHSSRDYSHEFNITEFMTTLNLDNKIGRSLFRGNYLKEKMKSGLEGLLPFLDQTEFYPLGALPIASGKAVFVPRTTYVLHYYQLNVPCGVENYWEESIYDINKQYDVVLSYLRGRIDNALFCLISDIRKIKGLESTTVSLISGGIPGKIPQTVEELLNYSGERFLVYTYQTLLGRAPDSIGLRHYLDCLGKGVARQQVIADISLSSEGVQKRVVIPGLDALQKHHLRRKNSWILWKFTRPAWENVLYA